MNPSSDPSALQLGAGVLDERLNPGGRQFFRQIPSDLAPCKLTDRKRAVMDRPLVIYSHSSLHYSNATFRYRQYHPDKSDQLLNAHALYSVSKNAVASSLTMDGPTALDCPRPKEESNISNTVHHASKPTYHKEQPSCLFQTE